MDDPGDSELLALGKSKHKRDNCLQVINGRSVLDKGAGSVVIGLDHGHPVDIVDHGPGEFRDVVGEKKFDALHILGKDFF